MSIFVARRIRMTILWKELALMFVIPSSIAFTVGYFHLTFIIGIPIILALSILLMIASRVLSRSEVRESIEILPDSVGKPLIKILNKL